MDKDDIDRIANVYGGEDLENMGRFKVPFIKSLLYHKNNAKEIAQLKKQLKKIEADSEKLIYSREESANLLNISLRKLDNLKADGEIKFTKIGRSIKFRKKHLLEFIKKNSIISQPYNID